MNWIHFTIVLVIMRLLFSPDHVLAQSLQGELNAKEIGITIDSIKRKLSDNYVFPEIATRMAETLDANLKNGRYNSITNPEDLARELTGDLRKVSNDKHLMVVHGPAAIARENALTKEERVNEEAEWAKELAEQLKIDNYGFKEVKVIDGNVGYIDLREFVDPKYGGKTLAGAMETLANTKAIIIDLRQNDGGSPEMVQLLASYFFSARPVHLANYYNRPKNERTESWTISDLQGARRPEAELYILTSNKTFSAAEAFSYELKQLKRATIIGERTAGGAHLTGSVIATDKFYVRIPQGRTTSPVTNSNWEGTGVTPDVEVAATDALKIAHAKALEGSSKR